jgi:hypothetical protein
MCLAFDASARVSVSVPFPTSSSFNNRQGFWKFSMHLVTSLPPPILPRSPKGLWHSLHSILVSTNVHARHTRDLSDPASQLLVTGRHNETSPLFGHLGDAIIGITALAIAGNAFKSWILGQSQCNLVLATELFQFTHDTISYARNALGQQTVHHGPDHV